MKAKVGPAKKQSKRDKSMAKALKQEDARMNPVSHNPRHNVPGGKPTKRGER